METPLVEARNELGLTQADMANKLGISRQTYAKLEADTYSMTIAQAKQICSVLGKKYEQIFFETMVN